MDFSDPFLSTQLITYIGNKRRLLPFINRGIELVKERLGKDRLTVLDGFSGSGATARLLKMHAEELYVNDLEAYAAVLSRCSLANGSPAGLAETIARLNASLAEPLPRNGFIATHYAPKDEERILPGERAFYTPRNARILDALKRAIHTEVPEELRPFCLGPLIAAASVHTNTSGVFKGFHKKDGVGRFGGGGEDALSRIMKEIRLEPPVLSREEVPVHVFQEDANALVRRPELPLFDLAYFDPPYNQHPYGSNYFMLNLLASPEEEIPIQDGVSGIARDWNRSDYNKRRKAAAALEDLVRHARAKYILLSYNDEGLVPREDLRKLLEKYGRTECLEQGYNAYRGSRNLAGRSLKVKELLWILEKEE